MNQRVVSCLIFLAGLSSGWARATDVRGGQWSPLAAPLFEALDAGDPDAARRRIAELRSINLTNEERRELSAISAIILAHSQSRDDLLAAQAALKQLGAEDPALLERPECLLGLGLTQLGLKQTASAIYSFSQACERLAGTDHRVRLGKARRRLAQAWAAHTEWEIAIPNIPTRRPDSPAQAVAQKRAHIEKLIADAADDPETAARLEFTLARLLLSEPETHEEGQRYLERLAQAEPLTAAGAEACLLLAEDETRASEAPLLLERAASAGDAATQEQALARQAELSRPRIELDAPGQIHPGGDLPLTITARNVQSIDIEIRRFDLVEHLASNRGALTPTKLPTSGAVAFARRVEIPEDQRLAWRSSQAGLGAIPAPKRGAYVIVARPGDSSTPPIIQPLIVSDLQAAALIGSQRGLLWAVRETAGGWGGDLGGKIVFWAEGANQPLEAPLAHGVACFRLPPDLRLRKTGRWRCVFECEGQVATAEGVAMESATRMRPAPAILLSGSNRVAATDPVSVFGAFVDGAGEAEGATVELSLADSSDAVRRQAPAHVQNSIFAAQFPLGEELAGETFRVVARFGGQVLPNLAGRFPVSLAPLDENPLALRISTPGWRRDPLSPLQATFEATYPWDSPLANAQVEVMVRAAALTPAGAGQQAPVVDLVEQAISLDAHGVGRAVFNPRQDGASFEGPMAVGLAASLVTPDGRAQSAAAYTLYADAPAQVWLRPTRGNPEARNDAADAQVGEPIRVAVGWLDPMLSASGPPSLTVVGDGWERSLPLTAAPQGLISPPWRPDAPGEHTLIATLPQKDAPPVVFRRSLRVAPGSAPTPRPPAWNVRLSRDETGLRVAPEGLDADAEPRLIVLDCGDPLAGLETFGESAALSVSLPPDCLPRRALLLAPSATGIRVIDSRGLGDDGSERLEIEAPTQLVRGGAVRVSARLTGERSPGPVTFVARLISSRARGHVTWYPADLSERTAETAGIQLVNAGQPQAGDSIIPETRPVPPPLVQALLEGDTLWLDAAASVDGATTFRPPLPEQAGRTELMISAFGQGGLLATDKLILDTADTPGLRLDLPGRMQLGDLGQGVVTIDNPSREPLRGHLVLDGGEVLVFQAPERSSGRGRFQPDPGKHGADVSVPPEQRLTLRFPFEAVRAGRGLIRASLDGAETGLRTSATVVVSPATASPERPDIRIERRLYALERDEAAMLLNGMSANDPGAWRRVELSPGDEVASGRLILVEEQVRLVQRLSGVEWRQAVPANTMTSRTAPADLKRIGPPAAIGLEWLSWKINVAEPGEYTHEYVVVATRSGVCALGAPQVTAGGDPVSVETHPADVRVRVGPADRAGEGDGNPSGDPG